MAMEMYRKSKEESEKLKAVARKNMHQAVKNRKAILARAKKVRNKLYSEMKIV